MRIPSYLATNLFALFFCLYAYGNLNEPVRKIEDVSTKAQLEEVVRVTRARVVYADYDLIKKDFSETRNLSNEQIDNWLLERTAYVSKSQALQSEVNTPIPHKESQHIAFRPPDYGRALVFATESGLIDAKGAGAKKPRQKDHKNGLATLGEVIREYLFEKMTQMIFTHSQTGLQTVASYGVIDLGFRVMHANDTSSPAGMILRQAHKRAPGRQSGLTEKESLIVEKVLRSYGVTSAGAYMEESKIDLINIQGTQERAIIDFGGFLVLEQFERKAKEFDGTRTLLDPEISEKWINPDNNLRVPYDIWGQTYSGKKDPKLDNPWIWSHQLAEDLAHKQAQRTHAEQHLRNLLGPIQERLSRNPNPPESILKMKHDGTCRGLFGS